jgi:hypothetical protein
MGTIVLCRNFSDGAQCPVCFEQERYAQAAAIAPEATVEDDFVGVLNGRAKRRGGEVTEQFVVFGRDRLILTHT